MSCSRGSAGTELVQAIRAEARRLGFVLAGVTTPEPPPHAAVYERWLSTGRHGSMAYLAKERAQHARANPRELLAECKSILVLAMPYSNPGKAPDPEPAMPDSVPRGRVAAYAWGKDYHDLMPKRMAALVEQIERLAGRPVAHRCYTDTGPILERDLAQRAGLGWIGKNTCLINPRMGSYLLLGEILLDLGLEPDPAFSTDHCGRCTRCIEACPTDCILPDRTLDARRCISYLTIELRGSIPSEFRAETGPWVFGCDICQMVCPWNRFAPEGGDPELEGKPPFQGVNLVDALQTSPAEFGIKFAGSPVRRAGHSGYVRNAAVAMGNTSGAGLLPKLHELEAQGERLLGEHASWAANRIRERQSDEPQADGGHR